MLLARGLAGFVGAIAALRGGLAAGIGGHAHAQGAGASPVGPLGMRKVPVYDPQIVGDLAPRAVADDVDVDIEAVLGNMTLQEKIAQMTQLDIYSMMNGDCRDPRTALNEEVTIAYAKAGIGSILNAPFPGPIDGRTGWNATEWRMIVGRIQEIYRQHSKTPMLYGIDTIHGATYVRGATLFGQPLSAAASFNPELVYKMGEIEAKDTLAAGIPWVFSPVLGIAVQPKWSRVYETFGEDPYLASTMGASIIRGIQASGKVAACMKHFIGYSNPIDGLDRADNVITDWDLVNKFAPSFLAATKAGVKTAMETYVSINGYPVIASHKILTDLLRHDMQFDGMLVSDYSEIDRMFSEHHLASTVDEAVWISLNKTSLDMNMGPKERDFFRTVEGLVRTGYLQEDRIDASVRRILRLKKELGLFSEHDHPTSTTVTKDDEVGSKEDQKVALDLARESIILLENRDNSLPLQFEPGENATVFVTGPNANNKGHFCGGWSVFWTGSSNSSHFPNGKTFYDALRSRLQHHAIVEYAATVDVDGKSTQGEIQRALEVARRSKYTIVVLGEGPYAEKIGDIDDLALPWGQREYLRLLTEVKTTKVILAIIAGRPRTLHNAHQQASAVVASFLPCEQGGEALTNVLVGDINPSGKLPITYPKHSGNAMPYFHRVNTVCRPWEDCAVEWPFGYGLSYSPVIYTDLELNTTRVAANGHVGVRVKVKNAGTMAAQETVLLFVTQRYRLASVPESKLLKRFHKVRLDAGETKLVEFTLSIEDWGYYLPQIGKGFSLTTESGEFIVSIQQSIHHPRGPDAAATYARARRDAGQNGGDPHVSSISKSFNVVE